MSKRTISQREGDLVRDVKALRATLRRLQVANEAVAFWNAERSMKLMLRNDPDVDDEDDPVRVMSVDLCIVVDDEDSAVAKAVDLEHEGYYDEDTMYVVDSFEVPMEGCEKAIEEELHAVARRINELHRYKVCPCGSYLIKDQADLCLFCQMTSTPDDLDDRQFCAICQDSGLRAHMATQPCCDQVLHRSCLDAWHARGQAWCPLCRQGR